MVTCSSPLNPLSDVFLPSFIKYGESKKVNFDDIKKNCEKFCKTHGRILYDDLCLDLQNVSHVNHSDTKCSVEYDFDMSEIVKAGRTKLSEYDVCDIIQTHTKVLQSGVPNFLGCRIPVKSNINIEFFRENLQDYSDNIICEFLEFGAPIGFEGKLNKNEIAITNHRGARDFADDIFNYLKKEASYGSILGPFDKNPFVCEFNISPLNSVSKKDSEERRVILDLSFPPGNSVNDFISKDIYLGEKIDLAYPNVDDLLGF